MFSHRLLVVDDNAEDILTCKEFLEARGFLVETAASGIEAIEKVKAGRDAISVVVLDYQMPGLDGSLTTEALLKVDPSLFILIFTGDQTRDAFVKPSRLGACAFVDKQEGTGVFLAELLKLCRRFEEERLTLTHLKSREGRQELIAEIGMVGRSEALCQVAEQVLKLRGRNSPVLILGETGTGKELVAHALHKGRSGPFVARNCADFIRERASSELFGHVKGAFTGAAKDSEGFFRSASKGTGFLDELHELDRDVQSMLLRALEQRAVLPMGASREIPIDCRFVAGAKANLMSDIEAGKFKLDLFSRLSENIIVIAPLRNRPEDIAPLVSHFCKVWEKENPGRPGRDFLASAIPLLESMPWPGNVRELRNIVFAVLTDTEHERPISRQDIELTLGRRGQPVGPAMNPVFNSLSEMKHAHIMDVLRVSRSLRDAAKRLGVAASTVHRYLRTRGIKPQEIFESNTRERHKGAR